MRDLLYDQALETHNQQRTATPAELELHLRLRALFFRGVIVSDSDLNNNPLFHPLFHGAPAGTLLEEAVQTGFLRRAARVAPGGGGATSQREVFDQFQKSSPVRARAVPAEHVAAVDALFSGAEKVVPPLVWDMKPLASTFWARLVCELGMTGLPAEERAIADRILDYVVDLEPTVESLRAGVIEKRFVPDHDSVPSQKRILDLVMRCYSGNLPAVWEGKVVLGCLPGVLPDSIPAGPEATGESGRFIRDYYRAALEQRLDAFEVDHCDLGGSSAHRLVLNPEALSKLSLAQIVELREAAAPDDFFARRYEALAAPGSQTEEDRRSLEQLCQARDRYWEALHKQGIALTLAAEEASRREARTLVVRHRLPQHEMQSLMSLIFKAASLLYGVGTLITLGTVGRELLGLWDRFRAGKGVGPIAEEAGAETDIVSDQVLKRPDYRVVHETARHFAGKDAKKPGPAC